MASTFQWCIDNGTATGSPNKGTTRTEDIGSNFYWKSVDDVATAYTDAMISDGTNSYEIFMFGKFGGTFNELSNCKFAHTSGALGTGLTLAAKVTSTYSTPATTAMSGSTDITSTIAIGSGADVDFSTTGPEDASPTDTLEAAGYTQYLVTQLQASGASPGDIGSIVITVQHDEN
jgi:hypothetical protein